MKRRSLRTIIAILLLLVMVISGCGAFDQEATPTPILVTATADFVIVTNTPTQTATPVLAPSVDIGDANATEIANNPNVQPSPSPTTLITLTPTFTLTPTNTPEDSDISPFLPVGVGPDDPIPESFVLQIPGNCSSAPQGGFATVYNNNPTLAAQLGCAIDSPITAASAYQRFERGLMMWVSTQGNIYSLFNSNTFAVVPDTWQEGVDPNSGNQQPPAPNLVEPIRGFGKVWREVSGVRDQLGWGTTAEQGGQMTIQNFERGAMVYLTQTGQTYILYVEEDAATWTSVSIPF